VSDEPPKNLFKKHANPFIKNVVSNVDKAFNYRPFEEERPNFRFKVKGMSTFNNNPKSKAIKARPIG
jgi:hypothetical protein